MLSGHWYLSKISGIPGYSLQDEAIMSKTNLGGYYINLGVLSWMKVDGIKKKGFERHYERTVITILALDMGEDASIKDITRKINSSAIEVWKQMQIWGKKKYLRLDFRKDLEENYKRKS